MTSVPEVILWVVLTGLATFGLNPAWKAITLHFRKSVLRDPTEVAMAAGCLMGGILGLVDAGRRHGFEGYVNIDIPPILNSTDIARAVGIMQERGIYCDILSPNKICVCVADEQGV